MSNQNFNQGHPQPTGPGNYPQGGNPQPTGPGNYPQGGNPQPTGPGTPPYGGYAQGGQGVPPQGDYPPQGFGQPPAPRSKVPFIVAGAIALVAVVVATVVLLLNPGNSTATTTTASSTASAVTTTSSQNSESQEAEETEESESTSSATSTTSSATQTNAVPNLNSGSGGWVALSLTDVPASVGAYRAVDTAGVITYSDGTEFVTVTAVDTTFLNYDAAVLALSNTQKLDKGNGTCGSVDENLNCFIQSSNGYLIMMTSPETTISSADFLAIGNAIAKQH